MDFNLLLLEVTTMTTMDSQVGNGDSLIWVANVE